MDGDRYVNGEWKDSSGEEIKSKNPHDTSTIETYNAASQEETEEAIRAAKEAEEEWADLSMIDRAEYLWDVMDILYEREDRLGELVSKECGKEISEGKADVVEAAHMVEFAAGLSRNSKGKMIPSEFSFKDSYQMRKPKGTISCITPWNFPVAIPIWHFSIPLVFGNTIVFKPSELTPKCGEELARIFDEVGIPEGVFNMVQGSGSPTGNTMVEDKRVDGVQFTGSAEVGWKINSKVGGEPGKTCACEMGGKNSVIITEKADMDIAINSAIFSSFKTTGQRCVSSEKIIVHEDVYDEFRDKFVGTAKKLSIGNPLDENTFMGPLVSEDQINKFRKYNEIAREEGANVLLDKPVNDKEGYYVGPFIYEINYGSNKKCLQDEVFGPHVALIKYSGDVDKAIKLNNDVDYGLAGSIVSEDYRQINKFRDKAEVGLAYGNLPCIGAEVQLPFGGIKKSGNGSPSARGLIDWCTEKTAWTLNNSEGIGLAQGLSSDIKTEED